MEKFILTSAEFAFLCAGMGGTEIYGIEDAYADINISDIPGEIRAVQCSLEKKGYAESDFDGNTVIASTLKDFIGVCVSCSKFVAAECRMKNGQVRKTVYYFFDDKIVKAEKRHFEYHLASTDKNSVYEDIKKLMTFSSEDATVSFDKVCVPQLELNKIKKELSYGKRKTAEKEMKRYFEPYVAEIILDAFEQKESFYSLIAADFEMKDNGVKSVMFISGRGIKISLKPIVVDLVTEVQFKKADSDTISDLVEDCLTLV